MRILLSWLEDFVEIPESPQELADALTMAGMAVDGVEEQDGETLLDLDITSNRPDVMNHFGMAREIAAIYRRQLKTPKIEFPEDERPASDYCAIEIADPDLCPRYVGRVLLGVEIKPSPAWIRRRLELCGIRSINNLADLTNYVLLELGHPTHAFDLDTLGGKKVIVRRAVDGEELRTLDGLGRTLYRSHLVIADAYKPVALAGVMGGLETEISDNTTNVLIEAAWFQPGSIRKTSRQFTLHTEASHRFERGADIKAAIWAADRIAGLLGQISPGVVLKGRIDAYPVEYERPAITLRRNRVGRLLGVDVPDAEIVEILERLGFEPQPTEEGWTTPAPSHRLDVEREVDLIEEVGRVHGFAKIESTLPAVGAAAPQQPFEAEEAAARETVRALGYDEMAGYAFIAEKEALRFSPTPPVKLRNPISELMSVMRTSTVPTMLDAVAHNIRHGQETLRLAEFGRVYQGGHESYEEPNILTLAATGFARLGDLQEQPKPFSFFDLKSDALAILGRYDLAPLEIDDRDVPPYLIPGRSARVLSDHNVVATVGEVDSEYTDDRKVRQPVFVAEFQLDKLYHVGLRRPQYRAVPKVPAVERDFSLLAPEGVPFAEIRNAIGRIDYLTSLEPVEVFRGERVQKGYYALLLRAVWQRENQSFTDEEINGYCATIVKNLEKKLRIQLRSS